MARIEVRNNAKVVQTIQFAGDDDAPVEFGELKGMLSLRDVDCDGYKDLLVRKSIGSSANEWFYLYRFDVASRRFVPSPGFEDMSFESVNCKTRTVHSYQSSGWAGCLYEEEFYRWQKHKLLPVRLEVQDAGLDNSSVLRTIYVWRNGKKTIRSQMSYPVDNCHALNLDISRNNKH